MMTPEEERELARFYDEHRGDPSLWEEKPTPAKVGSGGVVFSIRFTSEELRELDAGATAEGLNVLEFIKRAALNRAKSKAAAGHDA